MENAVLGSLYSLIKTKPELLTPLNRRQDIILGMAKGLNAIEKHLVYPDFKSENVLLTNEFVVKIADFGDAHGEFEELDAGQRFPVLLSYSRGDAIQKNRLFTAWLLQSGRLSMSGLSTRHSLFTF